VSNFPSFYAPSRIGTLFQPDAAAIAADAAAAGLSPAAQDAHIVHLVLVDMQVDFCHPAGNLYVPGALDDLRRTVEFIYRYVGHITHITCSLDSHLPAQIFFPGWWADADGNHPAPFTIIPAAEVERGRWRPLFAPEESQRYVNQLEAHARKQLCIWPYHVQIGSPGHALDPELWSAVFWHSVARNTEPHWMIKGNVPLTEHYSIVQPEVPLADQPGGGRNQAFMDRLAEADAVIVAGEAESHCVLETVEDIVESYAGQPGALSRVYVLSDCTSPVLHPEIDFHAIAQARFAQFAQMGVNFIVSSEVRQTSEVFGGVRTKP
jgi:nicotinamidase-related amidase